MFLTLYHFTKDYFGVFKWIKNQFIFVLLKEWSKNVFTYMTQESMHLYFYPNRRFFVQSQQWKQQTNVWDLIKVNNNETRTLVELLWTFNIFHRLFRCFYCYFEQVNATWGKTRDTLTGVSYTRAYFPNIT